MNTYIYPNLCGPITAAEHFLCKNAEDCKLNCVNVSSARYDIHSKQRNHHHSDSLSDLYDSKASKEIGRMSHIMIVSCVQYI